VPVPTTLTCEKAVAAAWARVGPDRDIASIEFHYGSYCPSECPLAGFDWGYVLVHPGNGRPDMLLRVHSDKAGNVSADGPRPVPLAFGG
jgi:hypothetical protein